MKGSNEIRRNPYSVLPDSVINLQNTASTLLSNSQSPDPGLFMEHEFYSCLTKACEKILVCIASILYVKSKASQESSIILYSSYLFESFI